MLEKKDRKKVIEKSEAKKRSIFFMEDIIEAVEPSPDNVQHDREPPACENWNATCDGGFLRSTMKSSSVRSLAAEPKKNVTWASDIKYVQWKSKRVRYTDTLFTSEDSPLATASITNLIRPAVFMHLPEHNQFGLLKLLPGGESIDDALSNPQIREAILKWQSDLACGHLDPEILMQLNKKRRTLADQKCTSMEEAFAKAGWYNTTDGWTNKARAKAAANVLKASADPTIVSKYRKRGRPSNAEKAARDVKAAKAEELKENAGFECFATGLRMRIQMYHPTREAWLKEDEDEDVTCFCGKKYVTKRDAKWNVQKESWVCCDVCDRWCHSQCAGTPEDFDGEYVCPPCQNKQEVQSQPTSHVADSAAADLMAVDDEDDEDDDAFGGTHLASQNLCQTCSKPGTTGPCPLHMKLISCYCNKEVRHLLCYDPTATANTASKGFMCSSTCRIFFGGKDVSSMKCCVCSGIYCDHVCAKCHTTRIHRDCVEDEEWESDDDWICEECE